LIDQRRKPGPGASSALPRPEHFPCFDGIRAIAAFAVIVFHAIYFCNGFRGVGGRYFSNLDVGVSVFFVTSGFLLYRPFVAGNLSARAAPSLRAYFTRRIARIYPAYWLVLAFFTLVVHQLTVRGTKNAILDTTLTYTYASRSLSQLFQGLPVAWSLVVEVTFYAFLPVYALAIRRIGQGRSVVSTELGGLVVLASLGLASMIAGAVGQVPVWMTVLPIRLHVFALGMLLAVLASNQWSGAPQTVFSRVGDFAWLWWLGALAAFFAIPVAFGVSPTHSMSHSQAVGNDLCRAVVGLFIVVPAVLGAQAGGAIRTLLRTRVFVFLGAISYGLYLWHGPVLDIAHQQWLGWRVGTGNPVALLLVGLPVVVAAAAASWFLVERHVIDVASGRRRLRRLRRATT
jgi:peptidoglycan/LPS O-acetylase OafA/YrhL